MQIDEPCLVLELDSRTAAAYKSAYAELAAASPLKLMLTTYFGELVKIWTWRCDCPSLGSTSTLCAPGQPTRSWRSCLRTSSSLGVVDGRNVWRTDLDQTLALIQPALDSLGADRLQLAPSSSLLYTLHDLGS